MQLFGSQTNTDDYKRYSHNSPLPQISRRNDLLGTNFLSLKAENQQGWQQQMSAPLNTKEFEFDFFNKQGKYNFLYGNPSYGLANPYAANVHNEK